MKEHVRAKIRLNTMKEIETFIDQLNRIGGTDKLMVEDFESKQRVSARSVVGMLYAMTDFNDDMYFVNDTNDGVFPSFIDAYRV
jgi:hypothetical protein